MPLGLHLIRWSPVRIRPGNFSSSSWVEQRALSKKFVVFFGLANARGITSQRTRLLRVRVPPALDASARLLNGRAPVSPKLVADCVVP
jgi:hypothetical protein